MMTMEKKYTRTLLAIFGGLLFCLALFNIAVDPFYIFATPRFNNFNYFKPATDTRQRLSKAHQVRHLKPQTVIIGTSRALQINQSNKHFQHQPVMNYALASSTTYEHYRYLQHANYHSQLKQVIYGLDFFAFKNSPHPLYYKDYRLSVMEDNTPNPNKLSSYLKDVVPSLFTMSALKASINTVSKQDAGDLNSIWSRSRRATKIVASHGHSAMFNDLEKSKLSEYKSLQPTNTCPGPAKHQHSADRYQYFRKILHLAYEKDIDLKLFISPSHIRFMEIYIMVGEWHVFENWKRDIATINKEEAALAGREPFKLWDFSGYNAYTTEAVPLDKTSVMDWYWESSHYTTELADIMLARMLNSSKAKDYSHFGRIIDTVNIESSLAEICRERHMHQQKAPAFFADYHGFIKHFFNSKIK